MDVPRRPGPWFARTSVALLLGALPGVAHAQLFLASAPGPAFTIGPLFLRASIGPDLGPVTVDVLWSLVLPPGLGAEAVAQDLYLLWPGAVTPPADPGPADPALARDVEARGFAVIDEGQLPLAAEPVHDLGGQPGPAAGAAPFVTYVSRGGPLGLSPPATLVRIPWTRELASRSWLTRLRLLSRDPIAPRKASWLESVLWGRRHVLSLSFNDVRSRALFPLYFERRDRVVRLADEPAQILVNFADADRLKVERVSPTVASRRPSESLENTEVVSLFLDRSEGISPQVLSVEFGYLSGLQAWGPILIPTLFFVLGNLAAVLVRTLAEHLGRRLAGRVHIGTPGDPERGRQTGVILPRDTLARIAPGTSTLEEVLRLCGPDAEHLEQLGASERRTLVYRGRRMVPHGRRMLRWLTTVSRWDVEHHEVAIDLERGLVVDVRALVRRSRHAPARSVAPGTDPRLP